MGFYGCLYTDPRYWVPYWDTQYNKPYQRILWLFINGQKELGTLQGSKVLTNVQQIKENQN